MREQRRAHFGRERSGVDDAARALSDKMPSRDLIREEYSARVDCEIEVPFLVGELKGMAHCRDARICDADLATA